MKSDKFNFSWSCVNSNYEFVNYVRDHPQATEVSYKTFAKWTNLQELREEYGREWTFLYRISAKDNWSVSFWKSYTPTGKLLYYLVWSSIEHFFVSPNTNKEEEEELAALIY